MNIGRLDRKITIESPTEAQDAHGGTSPATTTWAVLDAVWARKVDLRGEEFQAAIGAQSLVACKFVIRWRSDVTTDMRIRHDGVTYNIRGVIALGRRDALELMAEAVGV